MARGWESKAIESQQADVRTRGRVGPEPTPEELARRQRAESIGLALADTTAQLQSTCRPVHREMLQRRLEALEEMLAALAAPPRNDGS